MDNREPSTAGEGKDEAVIRKRIRIAELCGLTNVRPVIVKNVSRQGDDRFCGITSDQGWIPDYFNDLKAMHEAEKVFMRRDRIRMADYMANLWDVLKLPREPHSVNFWTADNIKGFALSVHATAAQRAEAFLMTMEGNAPSLASREASDGATSVSSPNPLS